MICAVSNRRNGLRGAPGAGAAEARKESRLGVHIGVCLGPVDAWRMLLVNNYIVWHETIDRHTVTAPGGTMPGLAPASYSVSSGAIQAFERVNFNLPSLFADGDGPAGDVEFYMGDDSQTATQALKDFYTGSGLSYTDFRGLSSLFFDDFSWGAPPGADKTEKQYYVSAQVTCKAPAPQLDPQWALIPGAQNYPITWAVDRRTGSTFDTHSTVESQQPPPNANPAHVLWALLTESTYYGAGIPTSSVDVTSFDEAAHKLYDEGFGISFMLDTKRDIRETISTIVELIQATLTWNGETKKWELKLLRDDYNVDDPAILTVDPDSASLVSFTRKACGALIHEVTVNWTNPQTEKRESVVARDEAAWQSSSQTSAVSREYYMIRDSYLAWRVALRDLRQLTWPQRLMTVRVDHSFWAVRPGDVVRVTWPELKLTNVMMRVVTADHGGPRADSITLSLAEDIYSLDVPTTIIPSSTQWSGVHTDPTPMDEEYYTTGPYVLFGEDESPDNGAVPMLIAHDSAIDCTGFRLVREVTTNAGTEWISEGVFTIMDNGTLASPLAAESETVITLANLVVTWHGNKGIQLGDWIIVGTSEDDQEIIVVTNYDAATDELTLLRGAYDTIPQEWAAGQRLWFSNSHALFLPQSVVPEGTHTVKTLTRTALGELPEASAPAKTLVLTDRAKRPTRPAKMRVEGTAWPADATSDNGFIDVEWANRNRLTEVDALKWSDGNVTPETQQETKIEILDMSLNVLHTETAASGATSKSIPNTVAAGNAEVWVRLTAVRDGVESIRRPMQKVVGL